MVALAVALLAIVVLAIGTAIVVGPKDETSRFEQVGAPVSTTEPESPAMGYRGGVTGDGDPDLFAHVMPTVDQVAETMSTPHSVDLPYDEALAAGPITTLCSDISVNALAARQQVWSHDTGDEPWELDVGVYDHGTAQEAARTITARQNDEFLECLTEGSLGGPIITGADIQVEVVDHTDSTTAGRLERTVLLEGYVARCTDDDGGTVAVGWRQVGRYTISAEAYGCDPVDAQVVDQMLDAMEARLG